MVELKQVKATENPEIKKVHIKSILLLILIGFLLISPVSAAVVQWEKTYGGSSSDSLMVSANSLKVTSDGGFILAGVTWSYNTVCLATLGGCDDAFLVKTDSQGVQQWYNHYGAGWYDWFTSVSPTSDNGYIAAGSSNSYTSGFAQHAYLVKTDANGNEVWHNVFTIPWQVESQANDVKQTHDGGYILTGQYKTAFSPPESSIFLIKTDAQGNLVWNKTYDPSYVGGKSVIETIDGYVVVGGGDGDIYLLKTDSNGNIIWSKNLDGSSSNSGSSVSSTVDGGYIIVGDRTVSSINSDIYLVKTDNAGNKVWERTFGGLNSESGISGQQTSEGGYIVGGTINPNILENMYVIKTDNAGNEIWNLSIGDSDKQVGYSIVETGEHEYAIAGTTVTSSNSEDLYLVKIAETPPASITNLQNTTFKQTSITWTWADPSSSDFNKVMVYLDGVFQTNITKGGQTYTATGLISDTQHIISTRTVGGYRSGQPDMGK